MKQLLVLLLSIFPAFAELDPELAQANLVNDTGMNIEPGIEVGRVILTDGDTETATWIAPKVRFGMVVARDSWHRFEFGLGVHYGTYSFNFDGATSEVAEPALVFDGGYGYSIGNSTFVVSRVELGYHQGSTEVKIENFSFKRDNKGLQYGIGADVDSPKVDQCSSRRAFGTNRSPLIATVKMIRLRTTFWPSIWV